MAYYFTTEAISFQPIADTSTTIKHKLGTIVVAEDPVYGEGEFIYLLGVASTVVGSWVIWGGSAAGVPAYQTILAPNTAILGAPLAVSMSINVAGQYGWYQISGAAVGLTNGTGLTDVPVGISSTAGATSTTLQTGRQVNNARTISAVGTPSGNLQLVSIMRPFMQGAIT